MQDQLNALQLEMEQAISRAKTDNELAEIEIKYVGRKGQLTAVLKGLAVLDAKKRAKIGALANLIKDDILRAIASKKAELQTVALGRLAEDEREDVTEPGIRPPEGHLHVVTHAINEIASIFEKIGFTRTRYREVEWDWYTFEALNMPKDHPARDTQETFFLDAPDHPKFGRMLLSTQATSGTTRCLAENKPPIRAFNIIKTYRREYDVTHVPMFHQIDVVYVDQGVAITHLRGVLDYFASQFFGPDRKTRLRPHHFRFTEPSFEIDVSCGVCGGTGINAEKQKCRVCKRGWLELGGAGMLHPNVLKVAGIDPKKYSGLAFGWGIERTYMMKQGLKLDDIRTLYQNDSRFLKQF